MTLASIRIRYTDKQETILREMMARMIIELMEKGLDVEATMEESP